MAWANRHYPAEQMPVAHWTLLTTLTDFTEPGEIGVFIDEDSLRTLDQLMARQGYLDGEAMAMSFRLLRSNSLIWHYWVHSYLLGEPLPAFNVLFWNMDTTRMPRTMHAFYLREMYLKNRLVQPDALTLAGETIDLDRITQPLYAVSAQDDHIAPWQSCYKIRESVNLAAPVRFVLSTSGHIMGIVNPPGVPGRSFQALTRRHDGAYLDPDAWLRAASRHEGSWWTAWDTWIKAKGSGREVSARQLTGRDGLCGAPGAYVHQRCED